MSAPAFTPAPWGATNAKVFSLDHYIASIHNGVGREAQWANAQLVAAAPDLYAALSDIMENPLFQTAIGGNPNMVEALMGRASSALAKARGEQ